LSSAYLEKGEVLTINALGLENGMSLRQAGDGYTYFGCKKSIKKFAKYSNPAAISTKPVLRSSNEQKPALIGGS
jgi:hypothetical protein